MNITPPDYPGAAGTVDGPPARLPNSLATAAVFMWLGALVYFVAYAIGVLEVAQERDNMHDWFSEDSAINASDVDQLFAGTMLTVAGIGLVSVLLWAWMAWMTGLGRRWARVVASILGATNIAFLVWGMAYSHPPKTIAIISWFTVIVGSLTIALLWNKESTEFYRAVRLHRRLVSRGMPDA